MKTSTFRRGLAPLVLLASFLAPPADAQLGYSPEGWEGMRVKVRFVGKGWETEAGDGSEIATGGVKGGRQPIDGLALRYYRAKLRYQVRSAGEWQEWTEAAHETGVPGKPIDALSVKASLGSVRYRAWFSGDDAWSGWARDGEPLEKGGKSFDAVEVAYRFSARPGDKLRFRVAFKGEDFGPWLEGGQIAEGKGPEPELTGIEVDEASGVRTEICIFGRGWRPTILAGRPAGDPAKGHRIEAVRFYSDRVLVRYRVKLAGKGWTEWCRTGLICGLPSRGPRIEAFQLEPDLQE